MTQYILSPNAQKSLGNIKTYSLEKFGEEQTITYLKLIEKKLQMISKSPPQKEIFWLSGNWIVWGVTWVFCVT